MALADSRGCPHWSVWAQEAAGDMTWLLLVFLSRLISAIDFVIKYTKLR